jgi:uncharacterized membrane protein
MAYPSQEQTVLSTRHTSTSLSVHPSQIARSQRNGDTSGREGPYSLARALGWFSIGLGLTQLFMPRKLGRAIGVSDDRTALMPLLGVREIASGLGVLAAADPTPGMRARVAGDVIDLALLGSALAAPARRRARVSEQRARVTAATVAVAGVTALDVLCALQLGSKRAMTKPTRLRSSLAINKPAEQLYAYWRNFSNLPRVMRHLEIVREAGDRRSHWIARGPGDVKLEWDAEITEDAPNQRIAWRSLPDSDVPTEASIDFKPLPAGRGTSVTLDIQYVPRGRSAALITQLLCKALEQQIENDLRRWKQLLETGEVATTERQPHGKRSAISRNLP